MTCRTVFSETDLECGRFLRPRAFATPSKSLEIALHRAVSLFGPIAPGALVFPEATAQLRGPGIPRPLLIVEIM